MKRMILLLLSACLLCLCLSGCTESTYEYPDAYSVGGAELTGDAVTGIKHIVIDWIAGRVELTIGEGETLSISESYPDELPEDYRLRYLVTDGILYIRHSAPVFRLMSVTAGKELTVRLPASLSLERVDITTSSADVSLGPVQADALNVDTSSGSVDTDAGSRFTSMIVSTSSGDIHANAEDHVDTLQLSTSSGKIYADVDTLGTGTVSSTSGDTAVSVKQVGQMGIDTSSGKITLTGQDLGRTSISTSSGSVSLTTSVNAADIGISTSSGDVTLNLLADLGFTLTADTSSGDVSYDIPLIKNGDMYTHGDGACRIFVSTSSGNITLGGCQ